MLGEVFKWFTSVKVAIPQCTNIPLYVNKLSSEFKNVILSKTTEVLSTKC